MTYEEVAERYGMHICPRPGYEGCLIATELEHRAGTIAPRERVVHWKPRRMTRSGLRSFLKVIARSRILNYYAMNKAMKIYAENTWAYRAGIDLHVRFPTSYSTSDRLLVRWLESTGSKTSPAAHRWAGRKEKSHV